MKRFAALLLCGLLLLPAGCAFAARQAAQEGNGYYDLYFRARNLEEAAGGDAIASESSGLRREEGQETQELAQQLIERLLAGPASEELASPFPAATGLLGLTVTGSHASVDLSRSYSVLSGVGLTMADYCITLTLTQLPEIQTVSITVGGQELAYRSTQSFGARDVLLSSTEDVVGTVDVTLYFLDENGSLTGEDRRLNLYEGDTQSERLLQALLAGPETKELTSVIPEDFSVQAVWLEEDTCYVNLPSSVLSSQEARNLPLVIQALARSLLSLDAVQSVRFLLDGEIVDNIGAAAVGQPFED